MKLRILSGEVNQLKKVLSKSYRGYIASISFDEDKAVYTGSVEETSESFRGRFIDEALKRSHAVVDLVDGYKSLMGMKNTEKEELI